MALVTLIMAKFYIQSVQYAGALCWLAVSFLLAVHPTWAAQDNSDSGIRTRVVPLVFPMTTRELPMVWAVFL